MQPAAILGHPSEVEAAGERLAVASVVESEQDTVQGEVSSRLQVSDGGGWSDGEDGEVNLSVDAVLAQAGIGVGVALPEVTEAEVTAGREGHTGGFVWVRLHLPSADLLGVLHRASFVGGPGDEGAVWGTQFGAWQDGVLSESVVQKHCLFFTPDTWKDKLKFK